MSEGAPALAHCPHGYPQFLWITMGTVQWTSRDPVREIRKNPAISTHSLWITLWICG